MRHLPLLCASLLLLAVLFAPGPGLDCARPFLHSVGADGAHSLTVCRRAQWLPTMPGQGSDGPGWAVMRDARDRIEGIVAIGALIEIGHPPRWGFGEVEIPLVAQFLYAPAMPPLPAPVAFLRERAWVLRAWIGAVPRSADFR